MAFRLLEYCVLIWKFLLSAKPAPKRLPVIVPLVVYIGKRRWNAPRSLHELLDAPAGVIENLGPILPASGYLLADLSPRADGALPEEPLARAILRLMRAAKAGTIDEDIAGIAKSLRDHPHTESFHQLMRSLTVFFLENTELSIEEVHDRLSKNLPPGLKDEFMSTAQLLMQKGREEGREEGRVVALQESVIEALEAHFDRIPATLRKAVVMISEETRLRWLHKAAVKSASISSFTQALRTQ